MTAPRTPLLSGHAILRLLYGREQAMKNSFQDPKPTKGKKGVWTIRPRVVKFDATGKKYDKQTIPLGEMTKREAIAKKNEVMETINRREYVVQNQIPFSEILDDYVKVYVNAMLASTTRRNYLNHIKNYIRPTWGEMHLGDINKKRLNEWMAALAQKGLKGNPLAYATRRDLLRIMSGVFTFAEDMDVWDQKNPCHRVFVGRPKAVYEKRMLTDDQIRLLLAMLPESVRLMAELALFCTLRSSEIMGLQWKHVDFEVGCIHVRQRWIAGDLDQTKTRKSVRDPQMGHLAERLKNFKYAGGGVGSDWANNAPDVGDTQMLRPCSIIGGDPGLAANAALKNPTKRLMTGERSHTGESMVGSNPTRQHSIPSDDDFVFRFPSASGGYLSANAISTKWIVPAAKKLGIYVPGFGLHTLRHHAVTNFNQLLGVTQTMKLAGHSTVAMSAHYTISDASAASAAVRSFQERIAGKAEGGIQ